MQAVLALAQRVDTSLYCRDLLTGV